MIKQGLEVETPFANLTNQSKKLKDWYSYDFAKILASEILKSEQSFTEKRFLKAYQSEYQKLELKDRLKLIAKLLDDNLELTFEKKLKVLSSLMGPKWPYEEGMMNYGFHLYPISQYVEVYGYQNISKSLDFIYELTQRFTGEFAIRPILNQEPILALKKLKEWSKDKNFHVRRLSSEGLRIRLPWGQGVPWLKEKPKKALPLFNKLRNDSSLYVRRSVANAMGDLIKVHPDLALDVFDSWLVKKLTLENLWVIKHAIRHPVKNGDTKFIKLKKNISKKISELS